MARTAGQMPQRLPTFEFGALARVAASLQRACVPLDTNVAGNDGLTARAVAYAGLAALLGLPILLLASMVVGAALAPPAAIALGYLAASHALASGDQRSAATINAVVLIGLVLWSLSLLVPDNESSRFELVAALLAPAFAAAPALARLVLTRQVDPEMATALRNAACLNQLAPNEAVLAVRRDGVLLAATRAARKELRLSDAAIGSDVGRCFAIVDRPKLSDAIARCAPGDEPVELTLQSDREPGSTPARYAASVTADACGAVCVRLAPLSIREAGPASPAIVDTPAPRETAPNCDVEEAVAFAVRHAAPNVQARNAILTFSVEPGIAARCERQICRRVLLLMIESALARHDVGDALHLSARTVKGVVLFRIVGCPETGLKPAPMAMDREGDLMALRQLTEEAGGTAVAEQTPTELRLSVRLDLFSEAQVRANEVDHA